METLLHEVGAGIMVSAGLLVLVFATLEERGFAKFSGFFFLLGLALFLIF